MSIVSEIEGPVRAPKSRREARARIAPKRSEAHALPVDVLTAGRLIALLEEFDPEAPIVIEGQYGGFEWVRQASRVPLRLNVNSLEGFGPHDRADMGEAAEAKAVAILAQPGSFALEE